MLHFPTWGENLMRQALKTSLFIFTTGILLAGIPPAEAYFSAHPLQEYEQGLKYLNNYRGNPQALLEASNVFDHIIQNHPDSPLGYLGMSQLKTLEAHRYDQHYNIKIITEEALPLALKAMHAGPTLNMVHDNYDRFEKIFSENDEAQDYVRTQLSLFPEKSATYLALGDYLSDQGDFEKALEYYKIALRFSLEDPEKLIIMRRIAQIYSQELPDAVLAAEFYEAALKINEHLPAVWESLGKIYFQLHRYDLSVQNLKKALDVFNTPELRQQLLEAQALDIKQHADNSQNTSLHSPATNLYYKTNEEPDAFMNFQQTMAVGIPDSPHTLLKMAH